MSRSSRLREAQEALRALGDAQFNALAGLMEQNAGLAAAQAARRIAEDIGGSYGIDGLKWLTDSARARLRRALRACADLGWAEGEER